MDRPVQYGFGQDDLFYVSTAQDMSNYLTLPAMQSVLSWLDVIGIAVFCGLWGAYNGAETVRHHPRLPCASSPRRDDLHIGRDSGLADHSGNPDKAERSGWLAKFQRIAPHKGH